MSKTLTRYKGNVATAKVYGWKDGSRPYREARLRVYKALLARHKPETILRHVETIVAILDRAKGQVLA